MHGLTTTTSPGHRSPGGRVRLRARRRVAALVVAAVLLPALTALLVPLRDTVDLATDVLAFLLAVVVVASIGGLWPALAAAASSSLLLNYYFTAPLHRFAVASRDDAIALAAFLVVAVAVSATA